MQFKNVIIFGATGDVGNSFVRLLLPRSERVTLAIRSLSKLDCKVVAMPNVSTVEFEFPEKLAMLRDHLDRETAHFDLIVNAIGSYNQTDDILSVSHFESLISSNFSVLQNILSTLRPFVSGDSKFINISSIASHSGSPVETAYSSSKVLVDNLMASLRFDEKYRVVRTLNVRPGAIVSKMTRSRVDSSKFIDPDELAELCLATACSGNSLTVPSMDVYRRS
jgi:short-subunit dehydrogenase